MEKQRHYLKGREPEKVPVEWEDPKCAIGEWSIAKTPRVIQGRKNENPNKGWHLPSGERRCYMTNIESRISKEELNLQWKEATGVDEKDRLLKEMVSVGMVNYDQNGNLTHEGNAVISTTYVSPDESVSIP